MLPESLNYSRTLFLSTEVDWSSFTPPQPESNVSNVGLALMVQASHAFLPSTGEVTVGNAFTCQLLLLLSVCSDFLLPLIQSEITKASKLLNK